MNVNIRHHLLSVPVSGWLWLTQADQWEMTFSCCSSYLLRLLIILSSHLSPLDSASLTTHQLGGRCERVTAVGSWYSWLWRRRPYFGIGFHQIALCAGERIEMSETSDWNVWNIGFNPRLLDWNGPLKRVARATGTSPFRAITICITNVSRIQFYLDAWPYYHCGGPGKKWRLARTRLSLSILVNSYGCLWQPAKTAQIMWSHISDLSLQNSFASVLGS